MERRKLEILNSASLNTATSRSNKRQSVTPVEQNFENCNLCGLAIITFVLFFELFLKISDTVDLYTKKGQQKSQRSP